jgi:hypothetical protein
MRGARNAWRGALSATNKQKCKPDVAASVALHTHLIMHTLHRIKQIQMHMPVCASNRMEGDVAVLASLLGPLCKINANKHGFSWPPKPGVVGSIRAGRTKFSIFV